MSIKVQFLDKNESQYSSNNILKTKKNSSMKIIKKTYSELFTFINYCNVYLQTHPEETKLRYAITRTGEKVNKLVINYQNKVKDLQLDHANVDEKGSVIFTLNEKREREYSYKKEDLKKLDSEIQELIHSEVQFEAYECTTLPENLEEEYRLIFEGILFLTEEAEEG